jgi:hypothetical protein
MFEAFFCCVYFFFRLIWKTWERPSAELHYGLRERNAAYYNVYPLVNSKAHFSVSRFVYMNLGDTPHGLEEPQRL